MVLLGPIALVAFCVFELFWKKPLLPITLLMRRDLLVTSMVAFCFGMYQYSVLQIVPYVLESPLLDFKCVFRLVQQVTFCRYTEMWRVGLVTFESGISALIFSIIAGITQKYIGPTILHTLAVTEIPFLSLLSEHGSCSFYGVTHNVSLYSPTVYYSASNTRRSRWRYTSSSNGKYNLKKHSLTSVDNYGQVLC